MAIANSAIISQETGDGADDTFTFDWQIYVTSQIVVYKIATNVTPNTKTLQVEGVDYTVAINSGSAGGVVTYTVAPTANEDSYIALNITAAQATTLKTGGKFRDDHVEQMSDLLTLLVMQVQELQDRSLTVPRELDNPPDLPDFGTVEGDLHYDGAGNITILPR